MEENSTGPLRKAVGCLLTVVICYALWVFHVWRWKDELRWNPFTKESGAGWIYAGLLTMGVFIVMWAIKEGREGRGDS